ncbi:hypothetical protein [Massilia sp. UBA6681]|uniref:hypothetical protein n=1 Tax=Massilia sp. UBA6681 TaxID=1946839 RepID=UPI0025BE4E49|nr:hypothetical protein [Massilia sp. UBA6681]
MSFLRILPLIRRASFLQFFLTLALIIPPSVEASDSIERIVTGQWRFTKPIDSADIASLDEREAAQLVGHIFTIRKDKVAFGDRDCGDTKFEAQRVEPTLYVRKGWNSNVEGLKLPNPVTAVEISCTTVFILNRNRLVIFWKGWFFDAVRVKR